MAFERAMRDDELWVGEMKAVRVGGVRLVLVRTESGVRAYEDRCAHMAVPMSDGDLYQGVMTCLSHGWSYDADTGAGLNPKNARLRPFPVRVEDGAILVDVSAPLPPPSPVPARDPDRGTT